MLYIHIYVLYQQCTIKAHEFILHVKSIRVINNITQKGISYVFNKKLKKMKLVNMHVRAMIIIINVRATKVELFLV